MFLTILCDAYDEEQLENNEVREVLHLHPYLAPYKVSVLPLAKKYHSEKALEVWKMLSSNFSCSYDEAGSIGKRYRRADASGTPWCLTVDNDTLEKGTVTLRDRDTMEQVTLKLDEVVDYINERIKF